MAAPTRHGALAGGATLTTSVTRGTFVLDACLVPDRPAVHSRVRPRPSHSVTPQKHSSNLPLLAFVRLTNRGGIEQARLGGGGGGRRATRHRRHRHGRVGERARAARN